MKRWAITSAIAMVVLLAPPAMAGQAMQVKVDVVVPAVHADAGRTSGPLLVLFQEDSTGTAARTGPAFELDARHLRMEADSADVSIHATGSSKNLNPTTTPSEFDAATVAGTANRAGYRWNLAAPANGAAPTIEAVCGDAEPSPTETITRVPLVNSLREHLERETSAGIKWDNCTALVVRGDFQLSLWEWDAVLRADGKETDIVTGSQPSPFVPTGVPSTAAIVGRDVEVYLIATNATLTIPALGESQLLLTGTGTRLAATALAIPHATGSLQLADQTIDLNGHSLQVTAPPMATIAGSGARLPMNVHMDGSAEAVSVNGRQLATASSGSSSIQSWILWPVGFLVLGGVLAGPVVYFGRRRFIIHRRHGGSDPVAAAKSGEYREAAYELVNQRRFNEALRLVEKARELDPTNSEATFVRGLCLSGLNRIDEALAMHTEADLWLQQEMRFGIDVAPLRAENAYEAARCCARLAGAGEASSDVEKTLNWLRMAVKLQESYAEDAALDVSLAPILAKLQKGADWWLQP